MKYSSATEMMMLTNPPPREIPRWLRLILTPVVKVIVWWKIRKIQKALKDYLKYKM